MARRTKVKNETTSQDENVIRLSIVQSPIDPTDPRFDRALSRGQLLREYSNPALVEEIKRIRGIIGEYENFKRVEKD